MSYLHKALSFSLAMLLLCACCLGNPLIVRAAGYTEADMPADSAAYYATPVDAVNASSNVDAQEMFNSALDLLETGLDPEKAAIWSAKTLFSIILGGDDDPNAQILDDLMQMMTKQDQLAAKVSQLQEKVIEGSIVTNINAYLEADKAGLVCTHYRSLRRIDAMIQSGSITASDGAIYRQSVLVTDIPGATPLGSICEYDELTYSLGTLLTMDYVTLLPNMPHAKLFSLYDQWQRRHYKWEHQGYEDRAFFQNCALSQYLTAATIDKLSLAARIQQLPEARRITLEERLQELNEQIALVKTIVAPMKVTVRDASERFYQYPGHETLFYTATYAPIVPTESTDAGLNAFLRSRLKGIKIDWQGNISIVDSYWYPFSRFNGDPAQNYPPSGTFKAIYDDYEGNKGLYEIFFSEDEGGFAPIPGANAAWSFVVQPVGHDAIFYESNYFTEDHLNAYIMTNTADLAVMPLVNYRASSTNTDGLIKTLIGIGIKPMSSANTHEPNNSTPSTEQYVPEEYSDNLSVHNNESGAFLLNDGDLSDFVSALLDGTQLRRDVDYTIEDTPEGLVLRLRDTLLTTLSEGSHTLRVVLKDGAGELTFTRSDMLTPVASVPATGGADCPPILALALLLLPLALKMRKHNYEEQ